MALDREPASGAAAGIDRLELLRQASDVAYMARDGQRSVDLARAAIDGVDATVEPATAARCYTLLARSAWSIGDSEAAFNACRAAAALLPADPPSVELARVLAEDARGLLLMSRLREAEVRCHEAIAAAQAVDARAEEGHARNTLGCCRGLLGQYDDGIGLVREALVIAEEMASPNDLDRAYTNLSFLLLQSGRLEEAAAVVFDSAAVAEQVWGVRLTAAAGISAEALVRLGRYREAADLLAQIGNQRLDVNAAVPYVLGAWMAIRCGRFEEADGLLARAGELTAGLADVQRRGSFHMLSAELALEEGRPNDAFDQVERALALAAGTDDEAYGPEMCALGVRALADRQQDAQARGRPFDADKAHLLATGLVQSADRLVGAPAARGGASAPRALAFASTCAAEASRLRDSDPDLWELAVRRWDAAGEPFPAAYSRWREAEALLRTPGGRAKATESVQRARRTCEELGAVPLQAKIEALAQRARLALATTPKPEDPRSSVASDLGLTAREVEVLGRVAAGRTDRQIAEELFISRKTVNVHVSNLLRKLDVASRFEAAEIAQRVGLH
jgi:DNA-binding CsgD family transcriptional regulator